MRLDRESCDLERTGLGHGRSRSDDRGASVSSGSWSVHLPRSPWHPLRRQHERAPGRGDLHVEGRAVVHQPVLALHVRTQPSEWTALLSGSPLRDGSSSPGRRGHKSPWNRRVQSSQPPCGSTSRCHSGMDVGTTSCRPPTAHPKDVLAPAGGHRVLRYSWKA